MGFPVPLSDWMRGPGRDFVLDFSRGGRPYLVPEFDVASLLEQEAGFARNLWGLLSLELWHQTFHDRGAHWQELRSRLTDPGPVAEGAPASGGATSG